MSTHIHKTALVPYSANNMYTLVNDVEHYPDFLPWCKTVRILSRSDTEVEATIVMGKAGLGKSFTTRNRMIPDQSIHIHLLNGPFSKLEGDWRFEVMGNEGCRVELTMDFEFSSRLLSVSLGPVFTRIADTLMDAFIEQAHESYG